MAMSENPLDSGSTPLDNKKKRPGDISDVMAGLGVPGGLALPSAAPKVMHSPVQPGLTEPAPAAPLTAFGAGQATHDAIGAGVNAAVTAGKAIAAPNLGFLKRVGEFGRGLFGEPAAMPAPVSPIASAQAAPAPAAPAAARPLNIVGWDTPPTPPARNPASPAQSGGSGAAGGVPAPQSLASGVNAQGNNVYDNASIARLTERNAPGGVPAQSFGGLPMPFMTAAPAIAPTQAPAVAIPRPARADAYNVRQADQNTGKIASALEDAAFRTGLRANRGSRSAADAQASILQTLAQLGGQRLGVAAGIAGGDRDTTAGLDRTSMTETGANQRTALADTGDTIRAGMKAASDERVAQLGTLAELNRPTQVTDASGHLLRVSGATSAPIQGTDGQPVRVPLEGAITPALALASLNHQLEAETSSLQPDQARMGALRQQIDALMRPAANSAPRPATQTATNTKTGERVRYNPTTQQWEPITAG